MSKDLTNQIFGSYKVLNRDLSKKTAAIYWNVECQYCHKQKSIRADSLKKNPVCKCQQAPLIGFISNEFKVIEKTNLHSTDNCIIYKCKCTKCGHIELIASNVLRSYRKHCSQCYQPKTTLIDLSGENFGYLTVLKRDMSSSHIGHENDAYWICKCNNCGTICSIRGVSLRKGLTKSCGCIKSYGEDIIAKILTQHNIKYQKEYKFNNLIFKQPLRFDFAIFKENGELSHLVEYDGIQHFETRESGWNTFENLQKIQMRDKIKNQYCKENNIKLIRIKYDEEITFNKIMGE